MNVVQVSVFGLVGKRSRLRSTGQGYINVAFSTPMITTRSIVIQKTRQELLGRHSRGLSGRAQSRPKKVKNKKQNPLYD